MMTLLALSLSALSTKAFAIVTCPSCQFPPPPPFVPFTIDIEGTIVGPGEGACAFYDCPIARDVIVPLFHSIGEDLILDFVNSQFKNYRNWFVGSFFDRYVLRDFLLLSQQVSSVTMQQAMIIGSFFDARQQLETQRLLQQYQNEAHRDYQPSEDFCWFGTNVRSMASTQERSRVHSMALNAHQMGRHLGNTDNATSLSPDDDKRARWNAFRANYCDPQDNNWQAPEPGQTGAPPSGLQGVCLNGGGDSKRVNIDIDYTRLIDNPRTLEVGFEGSDDREDVFALANNLYGHDVLKRDMKAEDHKDLYLALRSVVARRNVAENSFNAIVELKTAGTSDLNTNVPRTREFLAAILKEMGVPDGEIYDYIGEQPSYYAQLEILAKTIYQNPDFYANLYDKPANVARKSVALKAIELMLDRAIYESELRQEMVSSVLLSTKLDQEFTDINERLRVGDGT